MVHEGWDFYISGMSC